MAFLLLFPFFLLRFGLLSLLSREAVARAARFAPLKEGERWAYWVYQASNAALLMGLFFSRVRSSPPWLFFTAAVVCGVGLLLLALSVVGFASPAPSGMSGNGLYRFSRNPMYVAYFVFFLGCALLVQSVLLLLFLAAFQLSAHWIILAEERWCLEKFGPEYRLYCARVRRYL